MRPGMDRLIHLLRGEVRDEPAAEAEWMTLLDLAAEENILPWTASRLRNQIRDPGLPLAARLETIRREAQISVFLWKATLRSTLMEFQRRSIPVISLKGPWLMERLCGDASLKLYNDLDLLVRREDVGRSEALLEDTGFRPTLRRDDYHRPWVRNGMTIELHHDMENPLAFDFRVESAWERAVPARFEGIPALLLEPSDELLFLCLHSVRHRFERLSHVLDLTLAFRYFGWPTADAIRRFSGAGRVLALGATMASRLNPVAFPDKAQNPAADIDSIEVIADRLWWERMEQRAPRLDWRAQHRFFLELEPPGRRRFAARLRQVRILTGRLIDDDFRFAAALDLHRTWQVWLLRPVRLLLRSAKRSSPETRLRATPGSLAHPLQVPPRT